MRKTIAEAIFRDVSTKNSNYYFFLGRTLEWDDEENPPFPIDSFAYERLVRSDIITMKLINPNDVAFVIPRKNWLPDVVYDMYDDEYSDEVIGLNIISGGSGYNSIPDITITNGGGFGAQFEAVVDEGEVIGVKTIYRGFGYTSPPTVTVSGGGGTGAQLSAVLNFTATGGKKLEEAVFYVMTDNFNVYKCLDNNNNGLSTVKPLGTSVEPIQTSDGYIWKFMYTVPVNLRNRFLNADLIPVISALTSQFYSDGSLDNIVVTNKGTGYTTARITVSGDGFLEENPVLLNSVIVESGGSNYSDPVLTIADPIPDSTQYVADTNVFLGQRVFNSTFDFYEVVSPGRTGISEPTHKIGTVLNGTCSLKYVASRASGIVNVSDGEVTGVTLIGNISEVVLTNSGSGYTSPPNITFVGGSGSGASAIANMDIIRGSILFITVSNSGDGYVEDPTVIFGSEFPLNTEVLIGEQYFVSDRLYTITGNGTTGNTLPTHTSGSEINGTANVSHAGVAASGTVIRQFGFGYISTPTIIVSEPGASGAILAFDSSKSEAKIIPIIENGQIVGVVSQKPGIAYTRAILTVIGDGSEATLVPDLDIGNVTTLQANNEILAIPGAINAIKMISNGFGYGAATVEIQGDGVDAKATASIDTSTGRITKINITDPGSGYTFADVIIKGNGNGASARVIMSPFGGHGSNAPDELFSRALMFYSNVSGDLNQGLLVNNDYRQLGIIKNPRGFNVKTRFSSDVGSACFIVQANINVEFFPNDTDVIVIRTIGGVNFERKYRIVTATSSSVLLQSLDNDFPQINDTFTNASGQTFNASSVGLPTVDKYSGQMMFIENQAGFTPSAEETVTLRSIIQF